MNIDLPKDIENSILAAIQAGDYDRVADELAAAVRENKEGVLSGAMRKVGGESVPLLPEHIDLDDVAAEQGVGIVKDFRKLKADFWPADEMPEDFLAAIRNVRHEAPPHIR